MNIQNLLLILSVIILNTSCGIRTGYFSFKGKDNEIIATQKIKDFMSNNPSPSIVLRVPDAGEKATTSEENVFIYNSIEKELVIAGFDVKDRGIFNEVVNKSEQLDYKKLKELTNTELILELIRVKVNIPHKTNRFYTKKDKQKVSQDDAITRAGQVLEFKIIMLEKNEYGGSYSFYQTPCKDIKSIKDNCSCNIGHKGSRIYPEVDMCRDTDSDSKVEAFEVVQEKDAYEKFIRNGVKQMIAEIKVKK